MSEIVLATQITTKNIVLQKIYKIVCISGVGNDQLGEVRIIVDMFRTICLGCFITTSLMVNTYIR